MSDAPPPVQQSLFDLFKDNEYSTKEVSSGTFEIVIQSENLQELVNLQKNLQSKFPLTSCKITLDQITAKSNLIVHFGKMFEWEKASQLACNEGTFVQVLCFVCVSTIVYFLSVFL